MQTESAAARDTALARVAGNSKAWMTSMQHFIVHLPIGWIGTAEDLRHMALEDGLGYPHHHNAWGSAAMIAIKHRKVLVKTGEFRAMRDRSSHARMTPVYRREDA
jgi:hypothetical protein